MAIQETSDVSYPLHWPPGWPQTKSRQPAAFAKSRTLAQAREFTLGELRKLGVAPASIVISSNLQVRARGLPRIGQAEPADRGVAVYFRLQGKPQVLACDKWGRVVDNLYAIGKHIDAIRAQARYGVGTLAQAFQGYLALPPAPSDWEIVGVPAGASVEVINRAFRERAASSHPDQGGSHDLMARLSAARARLLHAAQEAEHDGT